MKKVLAILVIILALYAGYRAYRYYAVVLPERQAQEAFDLQQQAVLENHPPAPELE